MAHAACTAPRPQINAWLAPGGKLFVHIFVHRTMPYHFDYQSDEGAL
jgi:hypothetical protein